jgi:hypothetical protein
MRMVFKRVLLLGTLMSLALTGYANTSQVRNGLQLPGMFLGGASRTIRLQGASRIQEYDILAVFSLSTSATPKVLEVTPSFGPEQERFIREWFSKTANANHATAAPVKRQALAPSLQRRLQRNTTLPRGLERRVEPLPLALECQLPPVSNGLHRVILAGNVILLEDTTFRIVDLLRDVF